jgi:hypothetical protein
MYKQTTPIPINAQNGLDCRFNYYIYREFVFISISDELINLNLPSTSKYKG